MGASYGQDEQLINARPPWPRPPANAERPPADAELPPAGLGNHSNGN